MAGQVVRWPFRKTTPEPPVTLRAAGSTVDLKDRSEAARLTRKGLDQSWQNDAWLYYDAVGEVGFMVQWLATAVGRMRLYAAVKVPGVDDPVDLTEAVEPDEDSGEPQAVLSPQLVRDAQDAIDALSSNGLAELLGRATTNLEVAGEFYLVGYYDELGVERWEVRSIGELRQTDDGWLLADRPGTTSSRSVGTVATTKQGGPLLDPADSYLARIWRPHPRWSAWADSPMRRVNDRCEELLLLGRKVRANARSRLSAGILALPSELDLERDTYDDEGNIVRATPFDARLQLVMVQPISDESAPSAVVPITVKGPAESLAAIRHIDLGREPNEQDKVERDEALTRVLQGLSGPPEVVTSFADVKYANALAIDRQSFRYHVEPEVQTIVRALTATYLRVRLLGLGHPAADVERMHVWYDPADLVTNPDQGTDAQSVFDAGALSSEALRRYRGFDEGDAPTDEDRHFYLLVKGRGSAAVVGVEGGDPGLPSDSSQPVGPAVDSLPPDQPPAVTAAADRLLLRALTASASPQPSDLGARLVALDAQLGARTQTAAEQALTLVLARAGAKVRTKARAAGHSHGEVDNARLIATLGRETVEALGLTTEGLVDPTPFAQLAQDWQGWARTAHERALRLYARALGLHYWPPDAPAQVVAAGEPDLGVRFSGLDFLTLREDFDRRVRTAADQLERRLVQLAEDRLYDPDGQPERGEVSTAVPFGVIRGALAVAGGAADDGSGIDQDGRPVAAGDPPPGALATGPALRGAAATAGLRSYAYRWEHGETTRPFHPHLDLDGGVFHDQADEALAKDPAAWPTGTTSWYPGDHPGCTCHTEYLFTDPFAGLSPTEARQVRAAQQARDVRGRYVGRRDHPDDTPGGVTTPRRG